MSAVHAIVNFYTKLPNYLRENAWLVILILIVFTVGLVAFYIANADQRRETAQRINSIDDYINEIKFPGSSERE